ncbi:MAG: hypothetical protein JSR85_07435 [Proteobacteria bacterium]|nr:hypothetical protein [Pseudomonadota bacterium]
MMRAHLKYVISFLNFASSKHLLRKTISFLLIVALIYPDLAKAMQDEIGEVAPLPIAAQKPQPNKKIRESDDEEALSQTPPLIDGTDTHSGDSSSSPEKQDKPLMKAAHSPVFDTLRSLPFLSDDSDPSTESPRSPIVDKRRDSSEESVSPLLTSESPESPSGVPHGSKIPLAAVAPPSVIADHSAPPPSVLGKKDPIPSLLTVVPHATDLLSVEDRMGPSAVVALHAVEESSSSPESVIVTGSMLRFPTLELQRVATTPVRPAASIPAEPTERDALLPKGRGSRLRLSHGSIQDSEPMEEDRGRTGSKRGSRVFDREELFTEVRALRDVTGRLDDVEEGSDLLERQALVQKVRALDPGDPDDRKVIAFLQYAKDRINDGKFTWKQIILGGVGGTLIGIGVANAMPAILFAGLQGLGSQFHYEMEWGSLTLAYLFDIHTGVSLGTDALSRNVMIIGDLAGPSMEEFSIPGLKKKCWKWEIDLRKGTLVLVYTGASMAAFLPVYYLWQIESQLADKFPQQKSSFYTFFGCLAPTLFLDALFSSARAMIEKVDEFINTRRVRRAFEEGMILSPTRALRQQELNRFEDLIRLFRTTPNDNIHDFYEHVLVNGFDIKKNGIDMPESALKGADALRTLKALRKIHETCEIPGEIEKSWKRKLAKALGWGIPGVATVGRTLVFYAIIHGLLKSLGANEIANDILSGIFGGGIANLFQGKVEVEAVEQGVYQLLHGDDPESDASQSRVWSGARMVGKTYTFAQGGWNTLPYAFVGIAATMGWPVAIQIATLLFFCVADAFNNTMAFNESYGGIVTGSESLLSYKHATAHYKRNKLIRLVRRYKQAYETMRPDVMIRANALLSGESSLVEVHGSSEAPLLISVSSESHADHSGSDDSL